MIYKVEELVKAVVKELTLDTTVLKVKEIMMDTLIIEVAMADLVFWDSCCILGYGGILVCPNPPPLGLKLYAENYIFKDKAIEESLDQTADVSDDPAKDIASDESLRRAGFIEIEVKHYSFEDDVLVENIKVTHPNDNVDKNLGVDTVSEEALEDIRSQLGMLLMNNKTELNQSGDLSPASVVEYQVNMYDSLNPDSKSNSVSNSFLSTTFDSLSDDVFETESQTDARRELLMFTLHRSKGNSNLCAENLSDNTSTSILKSTTTNSSEEKTDEADKSDDVESLEMNAETQLVGEKSGVYRKFEDNICQSVDSYSTGLTGSSESGSYSLLSLFDSESEVDRKEEIMIVSKSDSFEIKGKYPGQDSLKVNNITDVENNEDDTGIVIQTQKNTSDKNADEVVGSQSSPTGVLKVDDMDAVSQGKAIENKNELVTERKDDLVEVMVDNNYNNSHIEHDTVGDSIVEVKKCNDARNINSESRHISEATSEANEAITESKTEHLKLEIINSDTQDQIESDFGSSESMSVSVDLEICVRVDLGTARDEGDLLSVNQTNGETESFVPERKHSNEYSFSAISRMYKEKGHQIKSLGKSDSADQIAKQIVEKVLRASQSMVAETTDKAISERSGQLMEINDNTDEIEIDINCKIAEIENDGNEKNCYLSKIEQVETTDNIDCGMESTTNKDDIQLDQRDHQLQPPEDKPESVNHENDQSDQIDGNLESADNIDKAEQTNNTEKHISEELRNKDALQVDNKAYHLESNDAHNPNVGHLKTIDEYLMKPSNNMECKAGHIKHEVTEHTLVSSGILQESDDRMQQPDNEVRQPDGKGQEYNDKMQIPDDKVQDSSDKMQDPDDKMQESDDTKQDPQDKMQVSVDRVLEPGGKVQDTGYCVQQTGDRVHASDDKIQESDKMQESDYEMQELDDKVPDQDNEVQETDDRKQDPDDIVKFPDDKMQELGVNVQELNDTAQEPVNEVQEPENKLQDPDNIVQESEVNVQQRDDDMQKQDYEEPDDEMQELDDKESDNKIQEPDSKMQEPDKMLQMLDADVVLEQDNKVIETDYRKQKPDDIVKELEDKLQDPGNIEQEPDVNVQQRVNDMQKQHYEEPDNKVRQLDDEVQESNDIVQESNNEVEEPQDKIHDPDGKLQERDVKMKEPVDKIQEPDCKMQELDNEVLEQDTEVQETNNRKQEPYGSVKVPDDQVRELDGKVYESNDKVEEPDNEVQEQEDKIQNLNGNMQEQDPSVNKPDAEMQEQYDKVQEPDDEIQELYDKELVSDDKKQEPDSQMLESDYKLQDDEMLELDDKELDQDNEVHETAGRRQEPDDKVQALGAIVQEMHDKVQQPEEKIHDQDGKMQEPDFKVQERDDDMQGQHYELQESDDKIQEQDSKTQEPDYKLQAIDADEVKETDERKQEPHESVNLSTDIVRELNDQVQESNNNVQESNNEVQESQDEFHDPDGKMQEPDVKEKKPVDKMQEQCDKVQEPVDEIQELDDRLLESDDKIQKPDSQMQVSNHKLQELDDEVPELENEVQETDDRKQEPYCSVKVPDDELQELDSKVHESNDKVEEPDNEAQEPKDKIQHIHSNMQEPDLRVKVPDAEMQEQHEEVLEPDDKIQELDDYELESDDKMPDSQMQKSDLKLQVLNVEVLELDNEVQDTDDIKQELDACVKLSSDKMKELDDNMLESNDNVDELDNEVHESQDKMQDPVGTLQSLDVNKQEPDDEIQEVDDKLLESNDKVEEPDNEVQEPKDKLQVPDGEMQEPDVKRQEHDDEMQDQHDEVPGPDGKMQEIDEKAIQIDNEVQESDENVKERNDTVLDDKVHESNNKVKEPYHEIQESLGKIQDQGVKMQQRDDEIQEHGDKVHEQDDKIQEPGGNGKEQDNEIREMKEDKMQDLEDKVQEQDDKMQEPDETVEQPDDTKQESGNEVHVHGDKLQVSDEKMQEPANKVQEPDTKMQQQDDKIQEPYVKLEEPDDKMQESDDKVPETDNNLQEPDNKMQEQGYTTQKQDDGTPESDDKIQESDDKMKVPDMQVQGTNYQMQETGEKGQELDDEGQEQCDKMLEADNKIQELSNKEERSDDKMYELDGKEQEPDNNVQEPDHKMHMTVNKAQQLDHKTSESGDKVHEQGVIVDEAYDRMQESGDNIQESDDKGQDPDDDMEEADDKMPKSDIKIQEAYDKVQELDDKMQDPDIREQQPDNRIQNLYGEMQELDDKIQEPDDKMQELDEKIHEPDLKVQEHEIQSVSNKDFSHVQNQDQQVSDLCSEEDKDNKMLELHDEVQEPDDNMLELDNRELESDDEIQKVGSEDVGPVHDMEQQGTNVDNSNSDTAIHTRVQNDKMQGQLNSTSARKCYQNRKSSSENQSKQKDASSDASSESIDDAGQYHPELYEQMNLPVCHEKKVNLLQTNADSEYMPDKIGENINVEQEHECEMIEHHTDTEEQLKKPSQIKKESKKCTYNMDESDEDSDSIDDSGRYHPELYGKQPESNNDQLYQNDKLANDDQQGNPDIDFSKTENYNATNPQQMSSTTKKIQRRVNNDKVLQDCEYSSDTGNNSDDIDDTGQYHPELYEQIAAPVQDVFNDSDLQLSKHICKITDDIADCRPNLNIEVPNRRIGDVGKHEEADNVCDGNDRHEGQSVQVIYKGPIAPNGKPNDISKEGNFMGDVQSSAEDKPSEAPNNIYEVKGKDTEIEERESEIVLDEAENVDRNKRIPIEVSVKVNDMTGKTKKVKGVSKKSATTNTKQEATDIHGSVTKSENIQPEMCTGQKREKTNQMQENSKESETHSIKKKSKPRTVTPENSSDNAKKQSHKKDEDLMALRLETSESVGQAVNTKRQEKNMNEIDRHSRRSGEHKTSEAHSASTRVGHMQEDQMREGKHKEKRVAKDPHNVSGMSVDEKKESQEYSCELKEKKLKSRNGNTNEKETDSSHKSKYEISKDESDKLGSTSHVTESARQGKKISKVADQETVPSEDSSHIKVNSEGDNGNSEVMLKDHGLEAEDINIQNKSHQSPEQNNKEGSIKYEPAVGSSDVLQQEQTLRRRSVDISHYDEISGLSAVEIDMEEDAEDSVDPSVVSKKLEKWLQEKRDISIRKETERFIKGGIPEEKNKIQQRVQATSNQQRRHRNRDEVEAGPETGYERRVRSRQNSFELHNRRSRRSSQEQLHSSPDGLYGRSRHNSQEGIYMRSRRSSQEEMYRRSRQNSVEGIYERSRHSSQDGKLTRSRHSSQDEGVRRLNSPEGGYSRSRRCSQDEINERSRNRYYDEGNRYSGQNGRYIRSRQNSVDLMYKQAGDTDKRGSQDDNRNEVAKRRDICEKSNQDNKEGSMKDPYGFTENNRKDVFEKCRQSSHDDLYERKELSRQNSQDLMYEKNDKNRNSPVFEDQLFEGRLGRKADYIEVKKFRKENKSYDKRRANFLTSAQLRIFCEPKKSDKPILGPVDMVSVSYERQKRKENEKRALEKNYSSVEINKNIEEHPTYSSSLQPKTFDVYRYEKHHKKKKKSNLKFDKVDKTEDQYRNDYRGQLSESGFSHKDREQCQSYNRNVQARDIGHSDLYHVDQYSKNRCAKKHDASVTATVVTANANQDNGEAFYSSNPDYVYGRSKYQQNLGGQKYPRNSDGPKDKSRMKIPASSGEMSKDGPLSLSDTFAPMERGQSENHNMSNPNLSGGRLSDSTTSLNNRQAPAKSPSRQNTLQKQTSVQSNQSELNGERRDDPHGIKFERLKNLEEDELMGKIKEIIGHLEKLEDYHRGDGMRIQKMLGDMYWDYTHLREMIADCMAENGYAVVSMKMLKTLNSIGIFKNDDVWFPTYYTYNTMWNFSDASSNLARTLSENDAVRLLSLNCGHKPYINALHSKNVFYVIKASLSILHNMARNSGMKHLFDENKTSETIMPFMESEDEMLKILATLTIANIVDEEENKTVIAETGTIHCMVSWVEKSISLPRRRFKGFTPQELTEGLNKLAVNDSNKMRIVEEGAVPLFLLMLQHDDVREQSSAGRIIWTLSFDKDVRQKLIENSDLITTLEKLTESTNKSVQQNANGALWVIKGENDISRESKPKGTPTKSHVFLSYSWSDKDTVLQIRDRLRAEGYAIWIDIEKGAGASLEGMANAIENSAVVLICMSEKYKQNPNCRTEAEYTFQLKKDYIPLMLQKKYRPDGWLGFILGAKLYFDFSGKYPFDKSFTGLLKELRGRGQVTPNTTPVGSNDTGDGAMVNSYSLTSYASPGTPVPSNSILTTMGQEELVKWLRNVKLTECIPAFLEFDGRLLMQLKQMRVEAPEFFYQCLEKRLNMSLIEILKFTRALEELH